MQFRSARGKCVIECFQETRITLFLKDRICTILASLLRKVEDGGSQTDGEQNVKEKVVYQKDQPIVDTISSEKENGSEHHGG